MKKIIISIIYLYLFVQILNGQSILPIGGSYAGPFTTTTYESSSSHPTGFIRHRLTLRASLDITISHCGSTVSSTMLSISSENGSSVSYRTSSCSDAPHAELRARKLSAGTYIITSEWMGQGGTIKIAIQGTTPRPDGDNMSYPIYLGPKSADFVYSNTQNTANFTNQYQGQSTNDVYYNFSLATTMDIIISHCGSAVSDTYVHLLNSSGTRIAYNNDYSGEGQCSNTRHAYLKMENLSPGIYYVVSEGYNANGNITTNISGTKSAPVPTPSQNANYIMSVIPTVETSNVTRLGSHKAMYTIQYFDGLGRPVENVQVNATTSGSDLISYQEYDAFGRESNNWLSAIAANNNGAFMTYSTFTGKAFNTYPGETKPYAKPVYEPSPLNRVAEQYGPGSAWQDASRSMRTQYLTNIADVDTLNCVRYDVSYDPSSDTSITIHRMGNYDTGQLMVTRMADEDGYTTLEFKDKLGEVLLTRQIDRTEGYKNLHDTYYIYDTYGNLSAVLPPLASDTMRTGTTWSNTDEVIMHYAYLYRYDYRNRCKSKKLPGCDWMRYIYDKADRLIFTQDGNQRNKSPQEWTFNIPDIQSRVILTGTCTSVPNVQTVNNTFVSASFPSNGSGAYMGYDISGVSLSGYNILQANYYDNYKFRSLPGFSNAGLAYESSGIDSKYLTRYGTDTSVSEHNGLLTGTAAVQLDDSPTPTYLYSVMYYDNRGRVVQSKSTNHLPGGIEKEYIAYNFTNQPEYRMHVHSATGKTTQTEQYTYTYDTWGRALITKHRLNSGTEITLADNVYDNLGRFVSNRRNGIPALTTNYTYNIRSWLKTITTSNLFTEKLEYYERQSSRYDRFNGNISYMTLKYNNEKDITYRFQYDGLSRLYNTNCFIDGYMDMERNVGFEYDKHGNIVGMGRLGLAAPETPAMIDYIILDYKGNQIIKAVDEGIVPTLSGSADFRSRSTEEIQYFYDANGNMTGDLNKGISNITYNYLNLPSSLSISNEIGSATNTYIYSAEGRKLSVKKNGFKTDYVGNIIYENDQFKRLLVDGGYYEKDIYGNNIYYFYIQDHLGNNHLVVNQNGGVIQTTEYYPFGLVNVVSSGQAAQPYKYNGKELDGDRGLNLYDYGARYMDPALGRFTTIDPLTEKYYNMSPYAYVMNNPMRYSDPLGMDTVTVDLNGRETNRIQATGEDVLMTNLDEVIITASAKKNFLPVLMFGMNYLGQGFTTYGGMQYTPSTSWRTGYFRTASGTQYSNNILKPLENGKYVRGVQGIRYGQQYAMARAKIPVRLGSGMGAITTGYSGYQFFIHPNVKDGFDTAAGVASIFFWELGVAYSMGSVYVDCTKNEINTIKENIVTNQNPLRGVYNPTTGQYD